MHLYWDKNWKLYLAFVNEGRRQLRLYVIKHTETWRNLQDLNFKGVYLCSVQFWRLGISCDLGWRGLTSEAQEHVYTMLFACLH